MKANRIPYIKLLPLILIAILFYKSVNSFDVIKKYVDLIINIFIPLIWAGLIAYIANPMIMFIENKYKLNRKVSILIVYLFLTGIIISVGLAVIPKIVVNITELIEKLPNLITNLENLLTKWSEGFAGSNISKYVQDDVLNEYIVKLSGMFDTVIATLLNSILSISAGIFKFIIGFVISIYILKDKEQFATSFRKFYYAKFSKKNADKIIEFLKDSDRIFSKYILGKSLDSLIIGIIALIGFTLMKTPYPLLLGMIIGITNMIPYFGPFIGAAPVFVIILTFNQPLAFWAMLFIFILQQFDGNILGPKILGQYLNMSPFWIIIAILVGGGLFGIIGMLVGVPIMAIIRNVIIKNIENELEIKKLDIH